MEKTKLIFEAVNVHATLPRYNGEGDAGIDVFACITDEEGNPSEIYTAPGETKCIGIGYKIGIPEGWFLDVRPRSGLSFKTPLRVANAPGTIDTNFKDEVMVIVTNTSCPQDTEAWIVHELNEKFSSGSICIKHGDKIAQLVLQKLYVAEIVTGEANSIGTDRGGGIGHSGV